MAVGTGPIPTESQFPRQTLAACLPSPSCSQVHEKYWNPRKWNPPSYKLFKEPAIFNFAKPIVFVHNKYSQEWHDGKNKFGPPVNYIKVDVLRCIFQALTPNYTVIYSRPRSGDFVGDDQGIGDLQVPATCRAPLEPPVRPPPTPVQRTPAFRPEMQKGTPEKWLGRRLEDVCRSGWGRLLSVANAIEAGTCRQGDTSWAVGWAPWRGGWGVPGLREHGNDTSRSTGRSGRQNAATRRNMRREEWVTVQGPVKKQPPDGMSHRGANWPASWGSGG